MANNEDIINKFYSSFQQLDAAGMNSCYSDDIVFFDPVFGMLRRRCCTFDVGDALRQCQGFFTHLQ